MFLSIQSPYMLCFDRNMSINTGSDLISIRAGSSEAVKLLQNGILLLNRHKKAEVGLKWSVFKSHSQGRWDVIKCNMKKKMKINI